MNAPTELSLLPKDDLTAIAPLSIKETVLAQFQQVEPNLVALAETYRAVAFDCTTTKGLDAAKKARADLRDNGRYMLQNAEKRIKAEVNDLKSVMAAEVARLIEIIKPVEDHVDGQIKAEEARKEAIAEAERQRKARHEEGIAKIIGYRERAKGQPSAAIQQAIDSLSAVAIGESWEEFQAKAQAEMNATIASLEALRDQAKADEEARAQAEALRLENERMARELAEAKAALAAQARTVTLADVRHMPATEAAKQKRQEIADMTVALCSEPVDGDTPLGEPSLPIAMPAQYVTGMADASSIIERVSNVRSVPLGLPAQEEPATLKLGTICERLGFTLTSSFISDALGIHPSSTDKNAKLYKASDYDRIRTALIAHIETCSA